MTDRATRRRMTRINAQQSGVAGMTFFDWIASAWRDEYPPGACCSLDPADWQEDGREAVSLPVPDVVLGVRERAGSGERNDR